MASKKTHQTKIEAFFKRKNTSTLPNPTLTKDCRPGDQDKKSFNSSLNQKKDGVIPQEDSPNPKAVQLIDSDHQDSDVEMAGSGNDAASTGSTSQGQSPSLSASGAVTTAAAPSGTTLPPPTAVFDDFTLTPITAAHMPSFQRLLKTLLPVAYPGRFFNDILATGSQLGRVAVWHGVDDPAAAVAGGIRARLEDVDPADATIPAGTVDAAGNAVVEQQLYVQTLGVLAPYRGRGVAARMLDAVVDEARALQKAIAEAPQPTAAPAIRITSVYAHVWESSDDSLGWYHRRGFTVERKLESYYRKLRPAGAWIVRKKLDG